MLQPDSENPLCPGVERTLPFPTPDTNTLPSVGESLTQGPNCRSSFGEDAFRHVIILQKW